MNVWPEPRPGGSLALVGSEGELVSVSIAVEPRLLEPLLDSLSELSFPVNPQIYHEAQVVRVYPDGRRETEPATMVEFPAYAAHLAGIRGTLARRGFDPESVWAHSMLEQIHAEFESAPAPQGAAFAQVLRYRRLLAVA
ncbi:MAG: hypothetical protein ACE141_00160 [Bryobacteraceae bacterium]